MRILFVSLCILILLTVSSFAVRKNADVSNPVSTEDSLEADRLKYMNEVMASIKGKEKLPADSVFKN